jgi:hypothetical protein
MYIIKPYKKLSLLDCKKNGYFSKKFQKNLVEFNLININIKQSSQLKMKNFMKNIL